LKVLCEPLKHRFLDPNKIAFWNGQEAENEFKVSCEPLKHRFLHFILFAFWLVKKQKKPFKCHSTTLIVA